MFLGTKLTHLVGHEEEEEGGEAGQDAEQGQAGGHFATRRSPRRKYVDQGTYIGLEKIATKAICAYAAFLA